LKKALSTYLALLLLGISYPVAVVAQSRVALSDTASLYPRVVRLTHSPAGTLTRPIVASVTTFLGGLGEEHIFGSADGSSFAQIGTITDPDFAGGLCCGTLYELPSAVGALPAGTLLWAGSVGGDTPSKPMQVKIFRSVDGGTSWTYLSNCATAAVSRSAGGLWEPQFTLAAGGELTCFYSDETVVGFSQLIQTVHSADGLTWSPPTPSVASSVPADRPGMAVVARLPNGRYFMTFELCGPAACAVYAKTSPDGLDWTPASNVGTRIQTSNNQWFEHTPTNAWAPGAGLANGRLFVVGQILIQNGAVDPNNGQVVFVNDSIDGTQPWTTLRAPVAISNPPTASNVCQNYSSPLLPSANGTSLLELASDFDMMNGTRVCKTYFATGSATVTPGLVVAVPNITASGGGSGSATITLTPHIGYRGTVTLSASIPGLSGTVAVAPTFVAFTSDDPTTATLTINPTAMASGVSPGRSESPSFMPESSAFASTGTGTGSIRAGLEISGLAIMLSMIGSSVFRRRGLQVARGASVMFTVAAAGCGGGISAPSHTLPGSMPYPGTLTATDVSDPTVTAQATFVATVTR
jgi:hypothetical protein